MAGITNSVNTNENKVPPTITVPILILLFAAAPKASAIGKAPMAIAKLVIKIGRKRETAASLMASGMAMPFSLSWLANSTIKIPFLVTRPMSIMVPIWLKIFQLWPHNQSDKNAPATAIGTVKMIIIGSLKLSNCAERIK
ncbi:hypothetical protein D3C73_1266020 [compost metagenome]